MHRSRCARYAPTVVAAPLLTFIGLMAFLVYGVWAIFDTSYFVDPYIAPFSSPCLATSLSRGSAALRLGAVR